MTEDHEQIEELLAGYALLALSGDDAARADRILTEHVPGCARCRATLAEYRAVAGDLALAAAPVDPPETTTARLHRAMDDVPLAGKRPRRGMLVALAASVVALVAMGGLSLVLGGRLNEAQTQAGTALEIFSAMRSPGAQPVHVEPQGDLPPDSGIVEVSAPDIRRLYLAADECPEPSPGRGYQLWLGSNDTWTAVGDQFWPDDGVLLLEIVVDVARYDEIWITEEQVGAVPEEPSTDGRTWLAELPATTA
ncbi:MAG TPA: anti-sigma factor [Actinomycetota bacterium]|nr:anti-sigma factor [Actinomycetota bacterium]